MSAAISDKYGTDCSDTTDCVAEVYYYTPVGNDDEIQHIFDGLMLIQFEQEHIKSDYYAWCKRKTCNK